MDSVQPPSVKESEAPEEKLDASLLQKGGNDADVKTPGLVSAPNDSINVSKGGDEIKILESVSNSVDEVKILESVSAQNDSTDAKILGSVPAQTDSINVSSGGDEVKILKSESVPNISIDVSNSRDDVKIPVSKSAQNDDIDSSNSVNKPNDPIKVEPIDNYVVVDQVGDPGSESDNHSESASNPKEASKDHIFSKPARIRFKFLIANGYPVEEARELAERKLRLDNVCYEIGSGEKRGGIKTNAPILRSQEIKRQTDGPVQRITSKEIRESVTMCIIHKDYPAVGLSEEQLKTVQASILEKIVLQTASEVKPKFFSTVFKPGQLQLTCADESTAKWLKSITAELKPWEGASLVAAKESEVSQGKLMLGLFPNSANDTDEKILGFVTAQNDKIDISSWSVVKRCVTDDETVELTILVSEESYVALRRNQFNLNYKFGQVILHNPRKAQKIVVAKAPERVSDSRERGPRVRSRKRKHTPDWKKHLNELNKKIELGQRNQAFLPQTSQHSSQPNRKFQSPPKQKFQSPPSQKSHLQPKRKFQLEPQQKHQSQAQQKFQTRPKEKFRLQPNQKPWSQPNMQPWSQSTQKIWSPPIERSWSPPQQKSWSRSNNAMGNQRLPQANETWSRHDECDFYI